MEYKERVFILVEKDINSGLVTVYHRAWQDQLTITATPDDPEGIILIGRWKFDPQVVYAQYPPVQAEDNNHPKDSFELNNLSRYKIRAYPAKILN